MADTARTPANATRPRRTSNLAGDRREPKPATDVWSRSGSKYRIRAVVLLALNALLFAGVGCFAFWIRSGVVFAPTMVGYWDQIAQTFDFGKNTNASLADFLLSPINVQEVPVQPLIVGLLFAALVGIPILISILYRFWSSVPFILVVGFLAVMPWLAITLLGSCIIASLRPFRTRYRFMSAVAGLMPIVAYLILAWHGSAEQVMGRFDPIERIKFIAPWVLAVVAATLLFAIVLVIAKIVDYRPGAIAPLVALMFGLPVGLFEFHVGRDELYYRLIEGLNQYHFEERSASMALAEATTRAWQRHPLPRPQWHELFEIEQQRRQFELASDPLKENTVLTRHQAELVERCNWFLKHFPTSRYTLNVLFIKGRALDMRVDADEFRERKWIRFYDSFPTGAARQTWKTVLENGPDRWVSAVARLQLARLEAREGDIDRAMSKLDSLLIRFDDARISASIAGERTKETGVLGRGDPESSLPINHERVLLEAHALRNLLRNNNDPIYGYEPISGPSRRGDHFGFGFLDLDPHDERYVENLRELKRRYVDCEIRDNIDLAIAKATPRMRAHGEAISNRAPQPLRAELLQALLAKYPHGDAAAEALYRLAEEQLRSGDRKAVRRTIKRLMQQHADSVWARQADRYNHQLATSVE